MPKSSKKKKDKSADFAKAKLKLGKGKQLANNATDTSFKARSIALPHQTIGLEKGDSKPTTRRNLTLDDLLVHLKHYNSTTRKDAIWGIRELLDAHPQLVETSVTPIIQACARIVGDEDAEVRKALLAFLAWFLRLVPVNQIRPHAPLLILFVTSAQTHIFPAIRIDAVRFLDLLLEITPEAVIDRWDERDTTGSRVLEGYLGLMSAGSGYWTSHKDDAPIPSTSSVTLSPNSKLVVLSSISSFLRIAISPTSSQDSPSTSAWCMASPFSTEAEFLTVCSFIQPTRYNTRLDTSMLEVEWSNNLHETNNEDFHGNFDCARTPFDLNGFSLGELGDIVHAVEEMKSGSSHSESTSLRIARLAHTLHPILVSTWLDVAPAVFKIGGGSSSELETQLAVSVGQIAGCLYGAVFRDANIPNDARITSFDNLTALLGYMSTYLPCTPETESAQSEQLLRSLSFAYCELTSLAGSLVALASQSELGTSARGIGSLKMKKSNALSAQIDRVGEYVVKALDGELRSPSHPLGYSLTASSYAGLVPTIWSLLKYRSISGNEAISSRVCISTINHAIRTSSKSGAKGIATQFVGTLVLLQSLSQAALKSCPVFSLSEQERFKEWYLQLPKVLWEIGAVDPPLTEILIRLLLRIAQRGSELFDPTTLTSIRSRLIPYFFIVHPQKGEVPGPFAKLGQSPRLRRLVLDAVFALLQDLTSPTDDDLKVAVDKAVSNTEDDRYWATLLASFLHRVT